MLAILRSSRYLSCLLVFAVAMLSLPHRHASAAMAGTESVIGSAPSTSADDVGAQRQRVKAFLQRQDVRAKLESHGISGKEAGARIDSLTDGEIALIAGRLDKLPAGGYCGYSCSGPPGWAVLLAVLLIALIVLLIKNIDE